MPLRVATYNVHGCVGGDGRRDPARVIEVLRGMDADVVAVQELHWDPGDALHLLDEFGQALGYTVIPGPTLLHGTGHYGNAVLTRLPVMELKRIDLSVGRREPRGAVDVVLATADTHVRVLATHLGLAPGERRKQMRQVLAHLDQGPYLTTVLMGDLNEWFLWGRPVRWLRAWFGTTPAHATFPARWPLLALDRIWVRPRERLLWIAVGANGAARHASDHLPLLADIAA
jgi:endonuclease/exonuclease/phosphatase family metal-dependent hydrolase